MCTLDKQHVHPVEQVLICVFHPLPRGSGAAHENRGSDPHGCPLVVPLETTYESPLPVY